MANWHWESILDIKIKLFVERFSLKVILKNVKYYPIFAAAPQICLRLAGGEACRTREAHAGGEF